MPTVSIYYLTLDNFAYPLLFWGIFLALLQFSFETEPRLFAEGGQTMKTIIRLLISDLWLLWLLGVVLVGVYILFKLIMTAIGWVAILINRPYLFGKQVPEIDGWVGFGSIVALLIVLFVVPFLIARHNRRKKEVRDVRDNESDADRIISAIQDLGKTLEGKIDGKSRSRESDKSKHDNSV